MAPKKPVVRLVDSAMSSLKDPRGTAGKVVEQAKGGAALVKTVAEKVGRSAVTKAAEAAGVVTGRTPRRGDQHKSGTGAPRAEAPPPLRPVPDVNEAGHTPAENKGTPPAKQTAARKAAAKTTAKRAAPGERPPVKKAAAKKAPAKKAPAKKAASKAPAKKALPKPPEHRAPDERPPEERPPE